jgi:hypothetical protein
MDQVKSVKASLNNDLNPRPWVDGDTFMGVLRALA